MTPTEHTALMQKVALAIRAALANKGPLGKGRITVNETAQAVVSALYGPRETYLKFNDETKALEEFKPKDEKAA